jgi:hypothetical protein
MVGPGDAHVNEIALRGGGRDEARRARPPDHSMMTSGSGRTDVALRSCGRESHAQEAVEMSVKIGDRIVIESERVGQAPREGEILEVLESSAGPRYRVRWEDEHESTIRPAAGSARIIATPGAHKRG